LKLKEIKNQWNKEKDYYKTQELGSGVHSFVRACLESEELFHIKEGSLSTKLETRKNEYIHENKAQLKRRADFVVYINSDIVIPLEAERYENIEAGKEQLFNYQRDFDKQYGILTDGFTWRFYNNNILVKEFNLDQIFEKTDLFIEFWKEYIKPEFYYLSFFEPPKQNYLFEEEHTLPVEQNRQMFFDDITKLIRSFKNKLQIEGYFNNSDVGQNEKKAIEITYAYIIQFILYKTLVDNEFGNFNAEFDERVKIIHEDLKNRHYKEILGIIDGISSEISKNVYHPFAKEQEFIQLKLIDLYQRLRNNLSDISPWLDIFVFIKKYNFSNVQNDIFGYIYENYLKELYTEEKRGQYFTDPAVVNFMLQQVGFTPEEIIRRYQTDKDSISVIDPACGSGTFLYSSVNQLIRAFGTQNEENSKKIEEIVSNNIFGLDIEEFPLYLAEMNIIMRMLPLIVSEKYNNPIDKKIKVFLTKDSIAEFRDTGLANTIHDIKRTNNQDGLFKELNLGYSSFVREESDLEEMKQSLEERPKIPRRRFDYVIGNPPYIGYNECSKQNVLIFKLIKKHEASLNDIYGVNLHSIPNKPKRYRPNPNLYAFFIALGIALLKDNGKLCYIIPQTILTAGDLDVVRYHLAKYTTIEKIITFNGKMFIGRGLKQNKPVPTSSLIIVLSKKMPSGLNQVEVTNYKDSNDAISDVLKTILDKGNDKKVERKTIIQNKLVQNVVNWNFIKQSDEIIKFHEEYNRRTEDIAIYYEHILAELKFRSKFYFDSGYSIDERNILKEKPDHEYYYYPKLDSKFWTIKKYRGFWPNVRYGESELTIKLRQANQGYNLLDSEYKIIWSYANPDKFYFTNLPVVWARNQFCAIGSKNKEEIFYLFALLNSPIINTILTFKLKSKQEKNLLLSITGIKEFVRVPKIVEQNQNIKYEIVERVKEMLALEEKTLSDFVDLSNMAIQKFDKVMIENDLLILEKGRDRYKFVISENKKLIENIIKEKNHKLITDGEDQKVTLSELKYLPIIDYEKQQELKNYIDDLVFALYFNINIENLGLDYSKEIKTECSKNQYYKLVTSQKMPK